MKTFLIFLAITLPVFVTCSGCEKTYHGSSHGGFRNFPDNPVSVQKALELADPFLDTTFQLRLKDRSSVDTKHPSIWVTLEGSYYYIVKDNYPSYSPGFYLKHAVRIHKITGSVIPPK